MTNKEQLSRTVALFATDFGIADNDAILRALLHPRITIVAGERVVRSLAGQAAISTAAMLMARTGHQVFLDIPDAVLVGHQPPLKPGSFQDALTKMGSMLINGVSITIGAPVGGSDIVFCLGTDLPWMTAPAARRISVGASDWEARFSELPKTQPWSASDWPFGGLASAVLMAAEAVKISAHILAPLSANSRAMMDQFRAFPSATLKILRRDAPLVRDVGQIDFISAGAVSNAVLYSLLRIPGLTGNARAFDGDISDHSNLNRNAILTAEWVGRPKVELFAHSGTSGFQIEPIAQHYPLDASVPLQDHVIVGVDDVPARWALARLGVPWMSVGATTDLSSMASVHFGHSACAGCLHPDNQGVEGPTPTIAFNSFLTGLLMAADLLFERSGSDPSLVSRHRIVCGLLPDEQWCAPVVPIAHCPAGCPASQIKRVI